MIEGMGGEVASDAIQLRDVVNWTGSEIAIAFATLLMINGGMENRSRRRWWLRLIPGAAASRGRVIAVSLTTIWFSSIPSVR